MTAPHCLPWAVCETDCPPRTEKEIKEGEHDLLSLKFGHNATNGHYPRHVVQCDRSYLPSRNRRWLLVAAWLSRRQHYQGGVLRDVSVVVSSNHRVMAMLTALEML
jgi:hypothetical protein